MSHFFTVGYGGRMPQEFVELLRRHGVATIVDVRLRPDRASMGSYAKARDPGHGIEKLLSDAGIAYVSCVTLGNLFVDSDDWRERYVALIDRAGELLWPAFDEFQTPFCLMCAEKRAADCHRRVIADALAGKFGWQATHLE